MNKNFSRYLIIWLVLVIAFNVIIFVIPTTIDGKTIMQIVEVCSVLKGGNTSGLEESLMDLARYLMNSSGKEMVLSKYGGSFWPGYIFVNIAFIVNLVCAYIALKEKNAKKLFYSIPLIRMSYSGLVITFIAAAVTMLIIDLSPWIGFAVCFIVLVLNIIALLKASWAAEVIGDIDEKVKENTSFINLLKASVQTVSAGAKSEELKKECEKLYDAVRFSDPVSNKELALVEAKITVKVDELQSLVKTDDSEKAGSLISELLSLIEERNIKCKALK